MAFVIILINIGVTSTASPMIMAPGVKSNSKNPRGPPFEKTRYITKPRTTVGMPISELKKVLTSALPRKSLSAISIEIGVPQSDAKITAIPEKRRVR